MAVNTHKHLRLSPCVVYRPSATQQTLRLQPRRLPKVEIPACVVQLPDWVALVALCAFDDRLAAPQRVYLSALSLAAWDMSRAARTGDSR